MINALSVDIEDWYYPELVRNRVAPEMRRPMAAEAVKPVLELFEKKQVKATFFILGEVAVEDPDLVRGIHSMGHEIASHGMSHRPLWELGREGLKKELDEFERLMKDILGSSFRAKGFRAPSFSLDNSTRWAIEVLKDKGYLYDSSIFPVRNKLYGLSGAPLEIYSPSFADLKEKDPGSGVLEFPLAACEMLGMRIPVAGGFYFRAIPLLLLKKCLRKINRRRPFVFYFHPWEAYASTPRISGLSPADNFITYWGIGSFLKKLENLIDSFSFAPLCRVLGL